MKKSNLILLHGALGCEDQLKVLANLLSDSFNVLTFNFEGHGDKPSGNEFSIDLFTENVEEFLNSQRLESTHIFGYSMGGYVALKLALKRPEVVNGVVTLGTKFKWTPEIAAKEVKMLNPEKIEEKVPAFAKRLAELHKGNDWKVVMKKTAKMMLGLGDGKKMTDENLKRIDHNVLIGIGELDNMVTMEESQHSTDLLSNGSLKVIDGFKHPIEQVDMDRLANVINDFISK